MSDPLRDPLQHTPALHRAGAGVLAPQPAVRVPISTTARQARLSAPAKRLTTAASWPAHRSPRPIRLNALPKSP